MTVVYVCSSLDGQVTISFTYLWYLVHLISCFLIYRHIACNHDDFSRACTGCWSMAKTHVTITIQAIYDTHGAKKPRKICLGRLISWNSHPCLITTSVTYSSSPLLPSPPRRRNWSSLTPVIRNSWFRKDEWLKIVLNLCARLRNEEDANLNSLCKRFTCRQSARKLTEQK